MDLDYDWAAHDAKKVDKSKPIQKASLKKPAPKKSSGSAPTKPVRKVKASPRRMTKQDSLQMTLG